MTKNIANAYVGIKAAKKMNAKVTTNESKKVSILAAILMSHSVSYS